jgi:hypothetical protein
MTPEERQAARARCEACEPMPTEYGPVDCCTTLTFALDEIDRLEAELLGTACVVERLEKENERLRGAAGLLAEARHSFDNPELHVSLIADIDRALAALEGREE